MVKVGRPPNLFSGEQVNELGKDLLIWLENEGKDYFMFEYWYYNKHGMFRADWKALIQRTEFLPYYEVARKKMSHNMVQNKDVPQSYGNRYLGLYDDHIKEYEAEIRATSTLAIDLEKLKVLKDLFHSPSPEPGANTKS